jgi:S-formylglutathione hydrolase FrmB
MKKLFTANCIFILVLLGMQAIAGNVDTIQIQSSYLKKATKFVVIQPSNQGQQRNQLNTQARYPVVYLLNGYDGNYAQWTKTAPQLAKTADDLKMIFVYPDGGKSSWYFDSPTDSSMQYESYIIKELVPYVDANFPTKANPKSRAITGLSMGGHGGLYLAIRHSDVFGAAGSTSGGFDFRPFPKSWNLPNILGEYETNQARWYDYTVMRQVELLTNKQLAIIFDCGVDDIFIKVNRALHEKLLQLKIDHDYIERSGGHNHAYWRSSIDFQMLFFHQFFQKNI